MRSMCMRAYVHDRLYVHGDCVLSVDVCFVCLYKKLK